MAEDPYAPPKSPVADTGDGGREGSYLKAILLGTLADIGGTYATSFVFLFLVSLVVGAAGGDNKDVLTLFNENGFVRGFMFVMGSAFSVLGGYVAARIANRVELNVSLATGVAVILVGGLLDLLLGAAEAPAEQKLLILATVPLALFGGWLRKRGKQRTAAKS